MNGRVVALQARMGVILYASSGIGLEIEFVVDTGFEGFLTLPVAVVEK